MQDREVNEKLGRIKRNNSHFRASTDTVYISKVQPSIANNPSIANAFYDAPTVITLFVPKDFLYGPYDASAAAENMLLAAHALRLGGCCLGSAWDSLQDPTAQDGSPQIRNISAIHYEKDGLYFFTARG